MYEDPPAGEVVLDEEAEAEGFSIEGFMDIIRRVYLTISLARRQQSLRSVKGTDMTFSMTFSFVTPLPSIVDMSIPAPHFQASVLDFSQAFWTAEAVLEASGD